MFYGLFLFHFSYLTVLEDLIVVKLQLFCCLTFQALETSGLFTHVMSPKHH